jgi:hypothetical protein
MARIINLMRRYKAYKPRSANSPYTIMLSMENMPKKGIPWLKELTSLQGTVIRIISKIIAVVSLRPGDGLTPR